MHPAMRRDTTIDRIVKAFAEAVSAHDFEAAEGWFAAARLHAARHEAGASAERGR
jgi:iron uptake system EfeUOB component EfeO/EfeM